MPPSTNHRKVHFFNLTVLYLIEVIIIPHHSIRMTLAHTALFFLFLAGLTVPGFSQSENPAKAENLITAVRVEGLKRTKPRTAAEPLKRFIGIDAALIDTDAVKAAVIDQGILEPLSVSLEYDGIDDDGAGTTLVVEVREKWSFFAMPVFFAGSGQFAAGAALFDSNAFGLHNTIGLIGMYQSGGWLAVAMYMDPPGGSLDFGWGASGVFLQGERRHSGANDETLRRFNVRFIKAGISPRFQINNVLGASLDISYENTALLDTGNPINMPEQGAQFIEAGPEFSIRKTSWDGYLLSEESAALKYRLTTDLDASFWHSLSFRGVYEKSLIPGFRLNLHGGGLWKPDAPLFLESGPQESAVNLLPNSFSARHYAGLSLGLEKCLLRFSFGTISLLGSWQTVYTSGPLSGNRLDYGVAGSLRFYMSRLAIPAVGLGAAYNIPADYFQFSASIGMQL